jgi:hypothetical protein
MERAGDPAADAESAFEIVARSESSGTVELIMPFQVRDLASAMLLFQTLLM